MSHLKIILSVGADIFHADMTKITVAFYNYFQMCFNLDSSASHNSPVTF